MTCSSLPPALMKKMMLKVAGTIIDKRDELCKVDSHIGDGDHGIGMGHGFTMARDQLSALESDDISKLMRTFGLGVVSGAGGASGPLFGGLFMEGGKAVKDAAELTVTEVVKWWRAALDYIQNKGKAKPGDKTMVDALYPAIEAMEAYQGNDLVELFDLAAKAAWSGVEKTKDMVAGQGRSRYLGERALGYQDAGATSVAIIFDTLRQGAAEG